MNVSIFKSFSRPMLAAILTMLSASLYAQSPWTKDQPLKLVVPYAAGGTVDLVARTVAKAITDQYGQPVVIENLSGADGIVGTQRVISAKPDGQTLLLQLNALTVIKHLPNYKGSDPIRSLIPVTNIMRSPVLLASTTKVPAKTLREWVPYCQSSSTESCAVGTAEILGRLFARQLQIDANIPTMVTVPYRGTAPALTDLLGGRLHLTVNSIPSIIGPARDGSVRILAVLDKQRTPYFPDVPTATESGFPQFQQVGWFGIFVPMGTPVRIVNAVAVALQGLRSDPGLVAVAEKNGWTLDFNSPTDFRAQIAADEASLSALVKQFPLQ